MKNGTAHLFIPGPTNIPDAVRRAMNVPMQDMRAPDFPELVLPLFRDLKRIFKTETGSVFIFPGSGTGAWEAAISNTLNRGDRVLMSRFGQFSHLWVDMAERLGLEVDCIDVEWGEGVPLDAYRQRLGDDKGSKIKAVFATHNETATGVTSDVAGVRAALDETAHDALLFVDGVSSIGSIDFRMDEWGVDLAITGSQKGLMLPAGLGILAVSAKGLEAHKQSRMERCYFSFEDMQASSKTGFFPYTPPTQLLLGLRASLDLIFAEGLEQIFARHHRLAEGVRRGVHAWGLKLCANEEKWWSDTVSAIVVSEDVDARQVIANGYSRYRTSFGAGLSKVAGRVFRIGHLGDLNEVMCLAALASAEMSLRDAGARIEAGSGVAAAQEWYRAEIGRTLQPRHERAA
ncbi:aminotransferase class V-fold PLP-dependent enzyme [Mesorhizobium sp. M7A.F.Ca.CA.001.09.2.1]|uniref:Serine--glyoxylate aminotransferase n=2 Tax=Mesorhizobium TaxID=68287 RepID=A0AB38THA3_9HYPH|nr:MULTISPECIES: aminotransferase class V-fold PLP-dependent enzyme [Mesorhizobium]RUY33535.1 aminotransferase class V-fold PLP-dependent enzyme [Mesorhizobium sp. M7A.F.Ca.CA.001.13.2.1]MDF3218156.1 aminotransferase class V-fold PLP-dependent enzyme [Mesorhizobium ciceri]RUX73278.1 aminotransferase class V-fold PLP-dependent enzyme [Mesorhizobium sp. M7A.F.Ca.US.005.03.1.1]RUY18363.1 aminotransferase class V-fold PLP-dependent enzyme [Mesorhizobium sp. M7A.F.Ca.US.005.03.2.1]RUY30481.1 aminot